ncbi:MAG TPA: hypothetical protein PLZ27_02940 [Bacillota bacterium]|nr:hypothetical protein [Bacillota bacterium]
MVNTLDRRECKCYNAVPRALCCAFLSQPVALGSLLTAFVFATVIGFGTFCFSWTI